MEWFMFINMVIKIKLKIECFMVICMNWLRSNLSDLILVL